jgi:hypothetical protein
MPLFWEKIGVVGKMSWVAILFLLLGVEYRAIDKEHHDNELAQQKALRAIGEGFTGVLSDQRNGFSELIKKSEADFKKATELASAQFDATMTKAQENLNQMTGGNTYPIVVLLPIPLDSPPNTFRLILNLHGNNPMFDVTVQVQKLPLPSGISATDFVSGKSADNTVLTAASLTSNRNLMLPPVTISPDGQTDFVITTIARNGEFHEKLHVRKSGDSTSKGNVLVLPWECSYEITRDKIGRKSTKHQVPVTSTKWTKTNFPGGQVTPR